MSDDSLSTGFDIGRDDESSFLSEKVKKPFCGTIEVELQNVFSFTTTQACHGFRLMKQDD